jgi:glycerol-3-phosphate dehydrogenase
MVQTSTTSLTAGRRAADLAALAAGEVVDVLVVGLGVTGAGVALEAASRGLSVAAVDQLRAPAGGAEGEVVGVHGGLRYLARLQFGVALESARERGILLEHTAPHLTHPLPMLFPLGSFVDSATARLYRLGITAGDGLRRAARTPASLLPPPRRVGVAEARRLVPALRSDGLTGGFVHYDGQLVDDARLVVALARTAAGLGARILTYARVTTLTGDGAELRDERTGTTFSIRARAVINAAGVWADTLVDGVRLRPSRGTHLVLRAETLGRPRAALNLPVPGSRNRVVFAVPQSDGLIFAGLTDEPVPGPVEDEPVPPESDIAFLLDVLSTAVPVGREDVVGAYAGLRPLLDMGDKEGRTADVSRKHALFTSPDGVTTIVGGKLTTYRRMGQDAVDHAVRHRGLTAAPSRSARLPLVGAAPRAELARLDAPSRLIDRDGTEAPAVAALAQADARLAEPVAPGVAITGAELLWGVRHEGALSVTDLIDRRCRVGLVPPDRRAALTMAEAVLAMNVV